MLYTINILYSFNIYYTTAILYIQGPIAIDDLRDLITFNDWNFNIFTLIGKTPYPMVLVVEHALDYYTELRPKLDLIDSRLRKFLICIQDGYLAVPYHNYIHATDVVHTLTYLGM